MSDHPLVTFRRTPASFDPTILEAFAETLKSRVAKRRDFHCLITGDAELQALNRQFRAKDYPTDVLSFPGEGEYLGDVAISLARARAQARERGHAIEEELRILMLHGVLHLCGMDHEADNGEMARAETRWRRKLNLTHGLIERASR